MTSTETDVLTWLCATIRALQYDVYTDPAPVGSVWPLVGIRNIGGKHTYSLQGASGFRIDDHFIQIGVYDNRRAPAGILAIMAAVATALEDSFNVTQGTSIVMKCDRKTTIGPMWLDHDNYWKMTVDWLIQVRTL